MKINPVPSMSPLPTYDPATCGNPFAWIVRTAPVVRERRLAEMAETRARWREAARQFYEPITT